MKNYDEMSDFEINKEVSVLVDFGELVVTVNDSNETVYLCEKDGLWDMLPISHFDPCNNPADAWPIIELILERLMQVDSYYQAHTVWEAYCIEHGVSKLRAAMICFLKMKDA